MRQRQSTSHLTRNISRKSKDPVLTSVGFAAYTNGWTNKINRNKSSFRPMTNGQAFTIGDDGPLVDGEANCGGNLAVFRFGSPARSRTLTRDESFESPSSPEITGRVTPLNGG